MKVVTAAEMRALDRRTIDERGIPGLELINDAGRAIAHAVADLQPEAGPVLVLCGKGNNGGDGFAAARMLATAGYRATVMLALGEPDAGTDAARALAEAMARSGAVEVVRFTTIEDLNNRLEDADIVVDALLGTGARSPLRDPLPAIVRAVNKMRLPVVAADLPTGLDGDDGLAMGEDAAEDDAPVIRAAITVTMGLPKVGLLGARGVRAAGRVRVEPLRFPRDLLNDPAIARSTLMLGEAARLLPARPLDGHKGTFGTVLVCAGSRSMPGAAMLATLGALRGGAGLVRLMAPRPVLEAVAVQLPEALLAPAGFAFDEALGPMTDDAMAALLDGVDAVVVGPGMSTASQSAAFLRQLVEAVRVPLVVDADALNIVAHDDSIALPAASVATPHPGEAARLLGAYVAEVQGARWKAAVDLVERLGCTVILKGYGSLVASAGRDTTHLPAGNTALARGGSGDVLAGVIGSLLAQGLEPYDAARLGGFVCGLAADRALDDASPRGLLTREVAAALPRAWRDLEKANH